MALVKKGQRHDRDIFKLNGGRVMNAEAGMFIIAWTVLVSAIAVSVMVGHSITPVVIGQWVVDRLEKFVEDHGGG